MIKSLNNKIHQPLSLLIAILMMFLIVFISSTVTKESSKLSSLKELRLEMTLSNILSNLIHEIQKERGISSGYLASKGLELKQALKEQRKQTDKSIKKTKQSLKDITNTETILLSLEKIGEKRKNIDRLQMTVNQSIDFYSQINDSFLKKIMLLSKISKIPKLTKNILAYNNFLCAKEYTGMERAIGLAILSNNHFFKNNKIQFIKLIAMQEIYLKKFFDYASEEDIIYYKNILKGEETKIISQTRKIILDAENYKYLNIKPQVWLSNMNIKINKINEIAHYYQDKINQSIDKALKHTQYLYILFILVNIFIIILFLFWVYTSFKVYKDEQIKRLIMEKYIISSSTDLRGRITYVSKAFCEISGYTKEELMGKSHNIVRHPDMKKETFKKLWETIQAGKVWTSRVKNRKKNGDAYWVYATIEPIFNHTKDIVGYASIRVDITSNVTLESKISEEIDKNHKQAEMLFQQSKLAQMGELISMIAHQWRQPLTAISATSNLLQLKAQMHKLDENTATELSRKITDYAQHLSSTINDFRNFFKEDKDKNHTSLDSMVKHVVNIIHLSLENENIELKLYLNSAIEINTYSNEVKQVIINIIKNAEDILTENEVLKPKITIKTEGTTLTISDNGGGIPEDIIDKIFDPYFSTKKQKEGTGLGLYMSKIIINEHCGGTLNVYNAKDGAVFEIILGEECA